MLAWQQKDQILNRTCKEFQSRERLIIRHVSLFVTERAPVHLVSDGTWRVGPESNGSHARISVVTSGTSESLITALSETLLLCMTFDFIFFHYFILLIQYFLSTYVYKICLARQISPVTCWFEPASKFYFNFFFFIKITLFQIIRVFFKKKLKSKFQ